MLSSRIIMLMHNLGSQPPNSLLGIYYVEKQDRNNLVVGETENKYKELRQFQVLRSVIKSCKTIKIDPSFPCSNLYFLSFLFSSFLSFPFFPSFSLPFRWTLISIRWLTGLTRTDLWRPISTATETRLHQQLWERGMKTPYSAHFNCKGLQQLHIKKITTWPVS